MVKSSYDTIVWLRLDKDSFCFENDVYLCSVYVWCQDSPMYNNVNVDLFDEIGNDINYFDSIGSVYIFGDFNSRVGKRFDFIPFDNVNRSVDLDDYIPDQHLSRASRDKVCNAFGVPMHLCKSCCFRIVNGRFFFRL